ncbi:MAG: ammonium transporter, partial [Acetobacteraceae bacterium]|nr:ammonium transporter [Acetobacteraceae bacterium]
IAGAFADRLKFSALLIFIGLWSVLIYSPIAHWVWSPIGWVNALGAADFAGGTVVHINAGVAGLVCALVLGKRLGYGHDNMAPYNLAYAVMGASLLWVGWFGFNAGSAVGANGRAGMAMLATQAATAAATLAWAFAEWIAKGKPSVLGAASGAVAGLVAITPASGFVLPGPAIIIGIAAGVICFWSATSLKHLLGYDDSLDAFGVHGVGGIVGALLTGVFAYGPLSGTSDHPEGVNIGGVHQLTVQCYAVLATLVYSGIGSFILLKITDLLVGLRVKEEEEREGLDVVLHGERLG